MHFITYAFLPRIPSDVLNCSITYLQAANSIPHLTLNGQQMLATLAFRAIMSLVKNLESQKIAAVQLLC